MDNTRCWFLLTAALVLAIALNPARVFASPTWETMRPIQTMLNNATLAASSTGKIKGLPGGVTKYATSTAVIPVSEVRTQAVKAIKRGKVHPGVFAATVAAGLVIDSDTGQILQESDDIDVTVPAPPSDVDLTQTGGWDGQTSKCQIVSQTFEHAMNDIKEYASASFIEGPNGFSYQSCSEVGKDGFSYAVKYLNTNTDKEFYRYLNFYPSDEGEPLNDIFDGDQSAPILEPLPESQYPDVLDPAMSPYQDQIAKEISQDPESDWSNDIPSNIESEEGLPPQLSDNIQDQIENAEAVENGEEKPNPETEETAQDAEDQIVDELTEPPTDLPEEPEAEWEVNEYDSITPEEVNIGSDSCPAPYVIDLVGDLPSVEITFDYICDFADYVRWFFLAGAWILAGTIVIRE